MTGSVLLALTAIVAYLIGAVPFGYLVARWKGVDILRCGSGNIGATNVGRILGRRYGILVFLLDFTKGAIPTLAAATLASAAELQPEWLQVTAGMSAFLGHLFPVYLRFSGGKGVATGAGIVTVLTPGPAAGALLVWVVVVSAMRYVSLASLMAAILLCVFRITLTAEPWLGAHGIITVFCLLAAVFVAVRHRANIGRLLNGTENRLKENPAMFQLGKTLHVMAVGLWFGTAIFFTMMGLVVFETFEKIAAEPAEARPVWLPLPALYDHPRPSEKFPEPLRKEQGVRVAGTVVGSLFDYYFILQAACAVIATFTALGWSRSFPTSKVHMLRATVLLTALVCVAIGWIVERVVSDLRGPRDGTTDALLRNATPTAKEIADADAARSAFARWHLVSVLLNLATVGLVTLAMGLTASLPSGLVRSESNTTNADVKSVNGASSSANVTSFRET